MDIGCLADAALDACATEHEACDAAATGYCELVLDCLALCPQPDAHCVDTCLGAPDSARAIVESFVSCVCEPCSEACGAGSCDAP